MLLISGMVLLLVVAASVSCNPTMIAESDPIGHSAEADDTGASTTGDKLSIFAIRYFNVIPISLVRFGGG